MPPPQQPTPTRSTFPHPHPKGHEPTPIDPNAETITHDTIFLAPKVHEKRRKQEVEEIHRVVHRERHIHHIVNHIQPVIFTEPDLCNETVSERVQPLTHVHERHAAGQKGSGYTNVGGTRIPQGQSYEIMKGDEGREQGTVQTNHVHHVHNIIHPLYDPVIDSRETRDVHPYDDFPPVLLGSAPGVGADAREVESGRRLHGNERRNRRSEDLGRGSTGTRTAERRQYRNEEIAGYEDEPTDGKAYGTATVFQVPTDGVERPVDSRQKVYANLREQQDPNNLAMGRLNLYDEEQSPRRQYERDYRSGPAVGTGDTPPRQGYSDTKTRSPVVDQERSPVQGSPTGPNVLRKKSAKRSGTLGTSASDLEERKRRASMDESRPRRRLHKSPPRDADGRRRSWDEERARGDAAEEEEEAPLPPIPVETAPARRDEPLPPIPVESARRAPAVEQDSPQRGNAGGMSYLGAEATASNASPNQSKPSFFRKLRGEAKVVSGKLAHDQGKVDTGTAIKEGYRGSAHVQQEQ